MRTAPFANGFFVGDYEGLTSAARGGSCRSSSTANSGNLANRTDVFSASVRASASAKSSRRVARASATRRLARFVKSAGAIRGPVRSP